MSDRRDNPVQLAQFGETEMTGFRADPRFGDASGQVPADAAKGAGLPPDPVAIAHALGFEEGFAQAEAHAAHHARVLELSREKLALSFARLDRELEEQLRLRLRETVAALCEAAIAPLALDQALLVRRIEKSVAMLARADDERVIRLHPQDLALVAPQLAQQWRVVPDPALERGALRIETQTGGVEDGPAIWRRAIAEALHQC